METPNTKFPVWKMILTMLYVFIWPGIFMLLAGDWHWTEGWLFCIWFISMSYATLIYLYLKDPALLNERFRKPGTGDQKEWDRYFIYGIMVCFLAWIILMPLDAKRFGWSPEFPVWLKILGGIGLIISFFFLYRAYTDNTFLSPLVRIQKERKQKVITTGVYGIVRHPMYLGALLMFIGTPVLLGSSVGIAIGILMTVLLAFRTLGEEHMMLEELDGYAAYMKKVRYRFIPYIW